MESSVVDQATAKEQPREERDLKTNNFPMNDLPLEIVSEIIKNTLILPCVTLPCLNPRTEDDITHGLCKETLNTLQVSQTFRAEGI